MKTLRIGFLLPRTSLHGGNYMCLAMRALAEAGADVDVVHPVDHPVEVSRVRVEHDLYVLRKTSGLAFSLAGALDQLGAAVVNPYPVSAALRDKIVTFRILQAAGIPTPATYVASRAEELAPLLDAGPLVLKGAATASGSCAARPSWRRCRTTATHPCSPSATTRRRGAIARSTRSVAGCSG